MQAAEAKVQKVLEGSKQFLVPHYQRPYSWDHDQWAVLWRDILELLEDENPQPHFMGSIVTSPARSVPEGVEKRLLIDGQQRLTTIMTLLALVRDMAREAGQSKTASQIEDLYLTNRYENGNDFFKLLPTQGEDPAQSDRETFMRITRGEGGSLNGDGGVGAAYKFFRNKLRRSGAPDIEALHRAIVGKLTLVSIILDDKDNPHRIFESLNGKGRPLTQADLIRNYFFMRIDEHEHDRTFVEFWRPMQKRLGDEALTGFVRHYLMRAGQVVRETDVYATLKAKVDQDRNRPPLEFLRELARFAEYYEALLRPEVGGNPRIAERLRRLNRLEVTVAYPLLMSLYDDFVAKRRDEAQVCAVLEVLENFLIRRFVCGVPTYGLNKVFPPLYEQAAARPDFVEGVKQILSARSYPRDDDFRDRLGSARLYGAGERREKTKFILERLEGSLGHKERVTTENLTIEHVMPQSLNEQWRTDLGPSWEEDHEQLLHTLGNLTLTSYNAELGNDAFLDKKSTYATSHVELNRYFETVPTWTAAEIERRADALAEQAVQVWPYFGPHLAPSDATVRPADASAVTGTVPRRVDVRGKEFPVRSWVEVAQVTLEAIAQIGDDEFAQVVAEVPKFVNRDASAFRRSSRLRPLSNGAFFESNMSAAGFHRWCTQAVQAAGLGPDEWHVVCSPNGTGAGDDNPESAPTELRRLQVEFWTEVRAGLADTNGFSSLQTPRPQSWFEVTLGRSGVHISLTANLDEGRLVAQLVMRGSSADSMFDAFLAEKDEIEEAIGATLLWERSPDAKGRFIRLARDASLRDKEAWPDGVAWLVRSALGLKNAFGPRVAAVVADRDDEDADDGAPSEIRQIQFEFWTAVKEALLNAEAYESLRAVHPRYWYNLALGTSFAYLQLTANVYDGRLGVNLIFKGDRGNEIFSALQSDRGELESAIGAELQWDPNPEAKRRYIRLVRELDFRAPVRWSDGIAWAVATVVAFKDAFEQRLAALGTTDADGDEATTTVSSTRQLQLGFWSEFHRRLSDTGAFPSLQTPRPQYWFDVALGSTAAYLSLTANVDEGRLGVNLVVGPRAADIVFPELWAHQTAIETEVGVPLLWDAIPGSKRRVIRLVKPVPIRDKEAWADPLDWLVSTVLTFRTVFAPRVAAILALRGVQ